MRVTNYEVLLNGDRIPHLVKESARNYAGNSCLTNPSQIAEFMRELYHADILPEEKLWMIAMNTKCKPLGVFELAHGSMDSAVMDQKAIFVSQWNHGEKFHGEQGKTDKKYWMLSITVILNHSHMSGFSHYQQM